MNSFSTNIEINEKDNLNIEVNLSKINNSININSELLSVDKITEINVLNKNISTEFVEINNIRNIDLLIPKVNKIEIIETGIQGLKGAKGDKGDKGENLLYSNLSPEEKNEIIEDFNNSISEVNYTNIFLNSLLS